jgi:hypothetical protein
MGLNVPLTVAVAENSFVPRHIRCLSLGDTIIELELTGEVVTDVALVGDTEASLSK